MNELHGLSLFEGVMRSGMGYEELWLRQFSLGGDADSLELEAYVLGLLRPVSHQHNVIAQAINEHFIAAGLNHPVAYSAQRGELSSEDRA